jgi:hypothetical protein
MTAAAQLGRVLQLKPPVSAAAVDQEHTAPVQCHSSELHRRMAWLCGRHPGRLSCGPVRRVHKAQHLRRELLPCSSVYVVSTVCWNALLGGFLHADGVLRCCCSWVLVNASRSTLCLCLMLLQLGTCQCFKVNPLPLSDAVDAGHLSMLQGQPSASV